MSIHDQYIIAYNDQYQTGKIGNGKNYEPLGHVVGYEFEAYPKSHPILKLESYQLVSSKLNKIAGSLYFLIVIPIARALKGELNKNRFFLDFVQIICQFFLAVVLILLYKLVVVKLTLSRAIWMEMIRMVPLECIGETNSTIQKSLEIVVKNMIFNSESFKFELSEEEKIRYLKDILQEELNNKQSDSIGINNSNQLNVIKKMYEINKTQRGDWI